MHPHKIIHVLFCLLMIGQWCATAVAQESNDPMEVCYRMSDPDLLPPDRYPALDTLSACCEARPEFQATYPAEYAVPHND